MGSDYEPELGQMLFGQPCQEFEVPAEVDGALASIANAWDVARKEPSPFGNTGERYDGKVFSAHAYSWADEVQEYNFAWRDVRISWYKYYGRGMSMNREMKPNEIITMLQECMAEVLGQPDKGE